MPAKTSQARSQSPDGLRRDLRMLKRVRCGVSVGHEPTCSEHGAEEPTQRFSGQAVLQIWLRGLRHSLGDQTGAAHYSRSLTTKSADSPHRQRMIQQSQMAAHEGNLSAGIQLICTWQTAICGSELVNLIKQISISFSPVVKRKERLYKPLAIGRQ